MPGAVRATNPKIEAVVDVEIDTAGRFKYILCSIADPEKQEDSKIIVRGTARAEFHSDIYDDLDSELEAQGLTCQCLGGGKIDHNPQENTIHVSGKSQGYGRANHSKTVELLRRKYPDYSITWCDD